METKAPRVQKYKACAISWALWENEITVNGKRMTALKASAERRLHRQDGRLEELK